MATFRYRSPCAGAPPRVWAYKALSIAEGEWGQFVYNGRFSREDYWWYEKHVVNVGLFERLASGVFTRNEATSRFEAMADLF